MNLTKQYIKKAYSIFNIPNFIVLRYARTRPLNGGAILTRILHKLYPSLTLKSKEFQGLKLVINPADFTHIKITDEFLFDKIYNLNLVDFFPDCIVDCGAHIGMFTLLSTGTFPKVPIYIFEPNPKNIFYLKKQISSNQLENIIVEEAAVSTYDGSSTFEDGEVSFGGHLSSNSLSSSSYVVPVINLINYIKKLNPQKLILKIDVEGEEELLIPLLLEHLPLNCFLFFEYHFGMDSFNKLKEKLEFSEFNVNINRVIDSKYIDALAFRTTV